MAAVGNAFLTVGVVTASTVFDKDKGFTYRQVIGTGLYLIILSVLHDGNGPLADKISLLVLISTIFVYGPSLAKNLGY